MADQLSKSEWTVPAEGLSKWRETLEAMASEVTVIPSLVVRARVKSVTFEITKVLSEEQVKECRDAVEAQKHIVVEPLDGEAGA